MQLFAALPGLVAVHAFSDAIDTPIVHAAHGDSSGVRGAAWLWPGPFREGTKLDFALMQEMLQFRMIAQHCAKEAAPSVHLKLAAISHQHREEDGSIIRPTNYPHG
jgi:hypothetical protein